MPVVSSLGNTVSTVEGPQEITTALKAGRGQETGTGKESVGQKRTHWQQGGASGVRSVLLEMMAAERLVGWDQGNPSSQRYCALGLHGCIKVPLITEQQVEGEKTETGTKRRSFFL